VRHEFSITPEFLEDIVKYVDEFTQDPEKYKIFVDVKTENATKKVRIYITKHPEDGTLTVSWEYS